MSSIDSFVSEFKKYELGLHGLEMPPFEIDKKYKANVNLPPDTSNYEFLRELSLKGFRELGIEKNSEIYKRYIDRAKYELEIVKELDFVDYFLLVWDVLNFCKESGIPTGAARGSCAGSLILHLIGVTEVDPIKYDLYFERFISKARAKKTIIDGKIYFDGSLFPDVDIDICYYNRHKVIDYLKEKFKGRTSKILTINTLSGKLCIKECGKIIGEKDESEMVDVASYIPKVFGVVKDLKEAYQESDKFKKWCDEEKEIYEIALKLENLPKNKGVHPSGYLLSAHPLEDSMPVELSSDKEIVSSYDMKKVAEYNIKLDLLGLRSVSVVDDCCKSLNINRRSINTNDEFIYQNLQDLKTPHGLFQIEAETNFKVLKKVKPKNIHELSAVISLGRPGGISFVDDYSKYTNEGILPDFDIESKKLKDILSETGGCLLFQETAMRIAYEVFELSLDVAEQIRKACSKKVREDMLKFEKVIKDQGNKLNIPKSAEFFWKVVLDSADYSFNKCLSLDTSVETPNGNKMLFEVKVGDFVKAFDINSKKDHFVEIKEIYNGKQELFEIELEDGRKIKASLKHKFLCSDYAMRELREIIEKNLEIVTD